MITSKKVSDELARMDGTYEEPVENLSKKYQDKNIEIDFNQDIGSDMFDEEVNFHNIQREERELLVKQVLDNGDCFRRDEDAIILDFDNLMIYELELHDWFITEPKEFLIMFKELANERYGKEYNIRFENLGCEEEISNIRVDHISKIVKVTGMITQSTSIKSITTGGRYECPNCGTIITRHDATPPNRCSCGRRGEFQVKKKFYMDIQEMFVEETYDNLGMKTPKKVRCRMLDDLCDRAMNEVIIPGTKVEVIGIAEVVPLPPKHKKDKEEWNEYRIHSLQVRSLENEFDATITEEDIEQMMEISVNNPAKSLARTIAPNIMGKDNEKLGLLLAMVRGKPTIKADGREDKDTIHMLLVGDAGQGKTDMTQACAALHWKGVYADCIGMTEPALTATAEQDSLTKAWGLKPGMMVKANGGLVVLDEFDKARDEAKNALHTVMESKIVTVNKASINTTLKADCTILLGANPKHGRFDPDRPLVEQINLVSTLLSRQDLIFVFRDLIEQEQDEDIADSILSLGEMDDTPIIAPNLFRKYIKYIQMFMPKMTNEASLFLKKKYIEVRQMSKVSAKMSGMPIGARHLKALKRLSEANAKLRMSETVEIEDVNVAYNMFEDSLMKLGLAEDGVIDFAQISGGRTLKEKDKMVVVRDIIKKIEEESGKMATFESIIIESSKVNINEDGLLTILPNLQSGGYIFSPRNGFFKSNR